MSIVKPTILYPGTFDNNDLEKFKAQNKIWETKDIFSVQQKELFELQNPSKPVPSRLTKPKNEDLEGSWVYFPWSGYLLHCVGPDELFELRTNRNRNLINKKEQKNLYESVVAVAGMSVGSGIALSMVYSGMSQTIKLADYDVLETANLNRLREPLLGIGKEKIVLASEKIYEINPFADIHLFENGIDKENIEAFFIKPHTKIVFDEIDDFKMKVELRVQAKKAKTALVMFTSLGDNVLVDIERYDTDKDTQIFNGLIGDIANEIAAKPQITKEDERKYAVQLVGEEYVPTRALESLLEMGKTLKGRPQLYGTIAVDGGLAAYVARTILLGNELKSGRYFIKFTELFNMADLEFAETQKRKDALNFFRK